MSANFECYPDLSVWSSYFNNCVRDPGAITNIQHVTRHVIYMPTGPRSLWTLQLSPFLPLHYFAAVSLIRLMPMTALILIKHHYWSSDAHIWEIQWEFLVKRFNIFPLFFSRNFHFIIYILKNLGHYRGDQLKVIKKKKFKEKENRTNFS